MLQAPKLATVPSASMQSTELNAKDDDVGYSLSDRRPFAWYDRMIHIKDSPIAVHVGGRGGPADLLLALTRWA